MSDQSDVPVVSGGPSRSRRWALRGLAGGAVLAGAGVAVWRGAGDAPAVAEPVPGFWAQHWESPTGQTVSMRSFQGRPLVVNFWATWCPPCVEELPLLDSFFKQNAANGWQVLGLAVDQPSAVRNFLQKTPVSFPIGLAGLGGTELGKSLGNLSGGLPFTVVFGKDGTAAHRKMGKVTTADLSAWTALR